MSKYLQVFYLSLAYSLKNRKALIGLSIFLTTCLVIFSKLWKVAATKMGAAALDPERLLWYIAFNEWVLISIPDTQEQIEQDFKEGRLAYLLPRPISYLGSVFSEALGVLTTNLLVLGAVAFSFTYFQTETVPFSCGHFILSIAFGVFSGIVAIILQMMIGLSAFWIHDTSPFYWIFEKLLFMLGGLMLPLAVYPGWIQHIASYTPFPAILGKRSALALQFDEHLASLVALDLLFWIALASIALLLLYKRALAILNVEGG